MAWQLSLGEKFSRFTHQPQPCRVLRPVSVVTTDGAPVTAPILSIALCLADPYLDKSVDVVACTYQRDAMLSSVHCPTGKCVHKGRLPNVLGVCQAPAWKVLTS